MKPVLDPEPAPKRGRYDRTLSRNERQVAQRERVLAALAAVVAAGLEPNVANVVEQAGVGRNTFYEYFDDVEHALAAVEARAARVFTERLELLLRSARTPLERVRVFARAWAQTIDEHRGLALLVFRAGRETRDVARLSALARCLVSLLERETGSSTALAGLSDPVRVLAVAAVFDAISSAQLSGPMAPDDLGRILAELALRLLR